MTLRQQFENEIKAPKGSVEFLLESNNQAYIAWLENKLLTLNRLMKWKVKN